MNLSVPSYVAGPLFLIALFLFCLFTVVGVKTVYRATKSWLLSFKKQPETPPPPKKVKDKKPVSPKKPIRSIEINPDEVDKIYVRKIS